ncbi:hypothetical protein Pfo_026684 [Paulownia fortunei]|nr:hypothetical protein Pfo_026684 [Paulownia fortunei]
MHMNRSKERSRILVTFPQAIKDCEDAQMEIVGSCDGLICLMNRGSMNIVIFNPSTRIFCCNLFFPQGNLITQVQVLNLNGKCKSRYLRSVDQRTQDHNYFFEKIGTLLHETLHWPACAGPNGPNRSRYKVVTYDFEKNEIVEIPAPGGVTGDESSFTLGVLDECLFAIFRPGDIFELWIMKEYGEKESWTKYRNIEGYSNFKFLTPLGFSGDGELIIDADSSVLTKYTFTEKRATVLNTRKCDNSKAIIFTESLLSFKWSLRVVSCYHGCMNEIGASTIGSVRVFNSNCWRCWERIMKKSLSPQVQIFNSQTRKKWMLRRSR